MNNEIEVSVKTQDGVRVSIDKWDNGGAWLHLGMKTGTAYAALTRDEAQQLLEGLQSILGQDKKAVQKSNEELERDQRDNINNLQLRRRAENCLKNEGIITLTQLQNYTENMLIKIPNLGRKSLKEIIEQLAELGYKLRDYA